MTILYIIVLDNDLPVIHHMIKHANYNAHHVDTHEINALLEKQLQQLVESRDLMIMSKVKCGKCNRNVVSRAVECSTMQTMDTLQM